MTEGRPVGSPAIPRPYGRQASRHCEEVLLSRSTTAGQIARGLVAVVLLATLAAAESRQEKGQVVITSARADAASERLTIRGINFGGAPPRVTLAAA